MIKKYISAHGVIIAVDDFYGGGEDEVVKSFDREGTKLTINTSQGYHLLTLKPGDQLAKDDGTYELIKSKYDKQDE